jgi:pyrimidine-nucleoside phosphorylase
MSGVAFCELIAAKRDGMTHSEADMERIILGFARGDVPDYQMSAWMMAALLNGLDHDETVWMTDAMVRSGEVVDLSSIPGVKVDKHSTGGVADTTTLVLAPLVAACGVPVAKMSGRGLGHTGGTLDKLESIPGMRIELSPQEFLDQVLEVGVAVVSQSPDIDPADKMMYALRDVTATVPSIPLIVGSIVSKKIAGGADAIVLDVKVGSGAFMKTEAEARELASELTSVGDALGKPIECLMTDMDQPLGMAVGNSLEVREAIETLRGEGPAALTELSLVFGERMLLLGEAADDTAQAREKLDSAISSGKALETFEKWVEAQGGDPRVAEDLSLLPLAAATHVVTSDREGVVQAFDAEGVGRSAMLLGAGRKTKDDVIDLGAGLVLDVRIGSEVSIGAPLATMYAASEALFADAESLLRDSITVGDGPADPPALFHRL